jgi:hypothetical protein
MRREKEIPEITETTIGEKSRNNCDHRKINVTAIVKNNAAAIGKKMQLRLMKKMQSRLIKKDAAAIGKKCSRDRRSRLH